MLRFAVSLTWIFLCTATTANPEVTPLISSPASEQQPAWSPDGQSIVYVSDESGTPSLWTYSIKNKTATQLTHFPSSVYFPTWSPDGQVIACSVSNTVNDQLTWDIGLVSSDGSGKIVVPISEINHDLHPTWSPVDLQLAFSRNINEDDIDIVVKSALGVGSETVITGWNGKEQVPTWSPDGRWLACQADRSGNYDIWLIELGNKQASRQLTLYEGQDGHPSWSPSGRKLAFASDRSGSLDIWVIDIGSDSEPVQITTDPRDERWPSWSPNGKGIVFESGPTGDSDIWVISDLPPEAQDTHAVQPTAQPKPATWAETKQKSHAN